ncbi:MAG: glycosyltransferase [Afipia sp.]
MTVTSPRLFIADFDLVGYSGHYFNQVLGFREAALARGIETKIYVSKKADPKIAEELDAHAVLPFVRWYNVSKDVFLDDFACAQFTLSPLWKDLEIADISERDILVITSSRPQVIFGLAQWMRSRSGSANPSVIFRFFGPEFFNFEAGTFIESAWSYYFASRSLLGVSGEERVFFSLNNKAALVHLEKLCLRRAFYLPVPKYYGSITEGLESRAVEELTIYVHTNRRSEKMLNRIFELVRTVLRKHGGVNFLVRVFDSVDPERAFDKELIGRGLELLPGEQDHLEYLTTIDRADMILLPYDPVEYRGIVSGVFCEAVAMGKVAIIPAQTWMADHVSEGRAAGVLFEKNNKGGLVEAVERAIRDRRHLQAMAHRCARPFREENSCAANLDEMIELAAQAHDMRLSHVPLTNATQALGLQHYFGEGWSSVEEDFGIWSDGDRAEINFSIRPDAKPLFFNVQVSPFLAAAHSQLDISLTANQVPVAEWSFDAARRGDRDWSWRHAQIPVHVVADGDIQVVLDIRSPASPKELGLSADVRKLGLALRQFSLQPEIQTAEAGLLKKLFEFSGRRGRWLKGKLR